MVAQKIKKRNKNGKTASSLQVVEEVLVQCNLVDNQYQQKPVMLYTFTFSKSYACLLNVEPSESVFLKT